MYGEMDGLKTLVQSTHMDLFKDKPIQMDTPTTVEFSLIQLKQPTMLLRSKDKLLLMLKRNLMPGEKDLLQTQAQFLNLFKRELTQMVTLSTMVFFLPQSSKLTPMPKQPELLQSMPKKNQMPGEMDGLPTQDQSLIMFKREPTQMVILSTTESSPIPFLRLTLTPRPLDKLPSMPKKNQMPGETDGLLTQDQLFHTLKYKIQTLIQSQTDMLNHTTTWLVI